MIDLSNATLLPEGGRKIYTYPNYFIMREYFSEGQMWSMKVGVFSILKNHTVRWYYVNPTEEEFDTRAFTTNLIATKLAVNKIPPAAAPKAI